MEPREPRGFRRIADRLLSPELQRGDPRGKAFTMVNGGHDVEDIPQLNHWRAHVRTALSITPTGKKVMLYLESGALTTLQSERIQQLTDQGMTLTDAEAQLRYETINTGGRKSRKDADKWRPALRQQIRREREENRQTYLLEVRDQVDALIREYPNRFVVTLEGQSDEVLDANSTFQDEIEAPIPTNVRSGRLISDRRAQLEDWAANQKVRETKIVKDITSAMSRKDVHVGVGLQGAWHHGGVDVQVRENLRLPDDVSGRIVTSSFAESHMPVQERGQILYPLNPQLDLMRRIINGEAISDNEIRFAIEAETIDFNQMTPEDAILRGTRPEADSYLSDFTADTMVIGGVYPTGKSPEYYRDQQRYVRLKMALNQETTQLRAVSPKQQETQGDDTSSLHIHDSSVRARTYSGSPEDYSLLSLSTRQTMVAMAGGSEAQLANLTPQQRRDLYNRAEEARLAALDQKYTLLENGVPYEELPEGSRMRVIFSSLEGNRPPTLDETTQPLDQQDAGIDWAGENDPDTGPRRTL